MGLAMLSGGYSCQVVTSNKKDQRLMVELAITCVHTQLSTKPSHSILERYYELHGNRNAAMLSRTP